ncbi:DUF3993 domain-containing protein [Aneurinibacillus aneurinilyticus]|uniref:DUF3993 domain-containing protein n=1 Tax=Aneurinibacillus aneurinilyticus ATCC 12856 TaxID=649747 RepID=U1Y9M8_ANEAE|nr:DUF3993 domain-containing protein [Aneurinibacillus aneurinilyticus]ERI07531.1 hypothetical protein HMPREF0083_04403 [Aneurinibacillus aneurinilyticus ATCC 12856]MED0709532.1 DUF3993 domain-containing protein [Aneurinibacillus aneurinilyticus]MED0726613.1 DUF3993 domain-containing protein [Aneurinibacillus aneurinilyticus]MED0733727.1 DUF3993 domain-containing protein [Aneurinibacillus aneurinilyticus]MED0743602.1 DUF3993 domain-containing protein [Aneurinibacillus aneurinilyticus]
MMQDVWKSVGVIATVFAIFFMPVVSIQVTGVASGSLALAAQSNIPKKESIRSLLRQAADAQYTLNEPMARSEVLERIRPYMTEEFSRTFLQERLVSEKNRQGETLWYVPGSDDMYLFIPDFSWDSRTKVSISEGAIHVSQYYPAEDGPWQMPAHKETVLLIREDGKWKVNDIQYE